MRIAISVVSICCVAMSMHAQRQAGLDVPLSAPIRVTNLQLRAPCGVASAVYQLVRLTTVQAGIENVPSCWFANRPRVAGAEGIDLNGRTVRDALDQLVKLVPDHD